MAKKIKRQIKRSMPLFVIICLVTSAFSVGLVFNYKIDISLENSKLNIDIDKSEASAQDDFATTTVTVKNAPPEFTVEAAEVISSTSTSPINIGYWESFTAQASDSENNDYYLIVCDQPGVTASTTGGAPACDNTTLCVSTSTDIAAEASCTYSPVVDPTSIGGGDDEIQDWYAYVCDTHASEGACSDSYSQGAAPNSGDNSSPFYVNNAPVYASITTTVDNRDPNSPFTVQAAVTDDDTWGGLDELHLYVCGTDSWATSTGCAVELCHGTSTTGTINCQFSTSTPALNWVAKDGTYDYYGYVKDEHELPAVANSRSSTYTVNNVAPTVSGVTFNNSQDITLNLKGADEVVVTATGTITDMNSCVDIQQATATVYWATSTGYNCNPDDDDCYHIGTTHCLPTSGSCGAYPDADIEYTCSTTLAFHAVPTDATGGNPNSGSWWEAAIRGFDESLSGIASSATNVVDVFGAPALDVTEIEIPYGSIRSGTSSGANNATTTIENYGNTPIDTTFEGVDMARQGGGGYIGALNQEYSLSAFYYGSGSWTLASGSPSVARDLILPKPTSVGLAAPASITDPVYWGIYIPAGKLSGIYDGSNIFRSAVDNDGW